MVLLMTSRAAPRKACSSSTFCLQAPFNLTCFIFSLIIFYVVPSNSEEALTWDKTAGKVLVNVSNAVTHQFIPANESHILTHLTLDAVRDDIYVGAVNRLYQLEGSTLKPIHQVVTGPRLDSPECHASGCEPNVHKVPTDNYNKVLVVAPSVDAIVACGSVSQGACDKYRLGNLSLHLNYIPKSVAANDPQSSTFAFIGPERYKAWEGSDALYIGTTFTGNGYYRNDVPAMSTRNLYDLNYVELSFLEHSLLRIDVKYRDHFLVQYVYGFNATDYVYFLTVQKKSHLPGQEEAGYVTRISRTCISDANYQSYTEITLECLGVDGVNYNLVQDAKLIYAGSDLAKSLGVPPGSPVLITVFLPSEGHTSKPKPTSVVCIFSVKDIEEKFNENIHMCFNGSMQYRNMEYISGPILDGKCPKQGETGNILSFCEVGLKISGPSPIVGKAALRLARTHVTSIQGTSTASHTVAFLGTSEGYLKKILIASAQEAAEYQEIPVDPGHKIRPDMKFTKRKDYLLVLSDSKVSKVKVESCSTYTNCSSCLKARDPYCGWCSLEKRCTIQRACQKATFSSPRWLSFGAGQQCIDFEKIDPDRLPIEEIATVELAIRTLPELPSGAKYQCVWGTAPPSDAEVTRAGLKCKTAGRKYRPAIPDEVDHVLVPLAVRSSETNKDFVSRNFAFFDCSRHTTCNACVRSEWACNWCVYENVCTQNTSSCRKSIISGENNPAKLLSHGSSFCPRFWRESSELLAADEAQTELVLLAENLPTPRTDQLGFQCVVTIEGATMVVGAMLSGPPSLNDMIGNHNRTLREKSSTHSLQKVICAPTVYRFESLVGEYLARVTLVWNRNHVVDWRPLIIYKCGVLGAYRGHQDCSLCVTRPSKFQCSWCGGACKHSLNCSANAQPMMQTGVSKMESDLAFGKQCPTPRIDVIQPLAGPLEGGTLVTIEGSNLGLKEEDIRGRVFIGDIPCEVEDYHVSIRIICRTGPVPKRIWHSPPEQLQFPIVVTTPAGTTQSTVRFAYSNVTVSDVWPSLGPVSGGTMLSIKGNFLNVGSQVTAYLDDLLCTVNKTQSSSHRLVCMTSRATPLLATEGVAVGKVSTSEKSDSPVLPFLTKKLVVNIDGAERTLLKPFTYMPDPSIFEIKPLRSPWKGGRMLTVHGRHLNAVQVPKITVLLQDHVLNSSVCTVLSPSQMECPSPAVDKDLVHALLREKRSLRDGLRSKRDGSKRKGLTSYKVSRSPRQNLMDSMALDIGFLMDNVASVKNLKHVLHSSARSSLVYVPNPSFMGFPNNIKLYKGDTLVIEGEGLNLASDESDVNVTVGTKPCNVTSLALTQLVCSPPEYQPDPTDEMGKNANENFPLVVVRVGRNMRFPIGYLRYEMMKDYQFPPEAIGGMAAGGLFLVLVSMAILVVYRRKSNQAEREYKRIQIQMDTLESNVRSECKQAFAELQTDMTDMTADLESSGIPTLDQGTYVMKVFFPGVIDHPILNDPKIRMNGCRPALENALIEFEQLINNRYFLLTAIDALESQKTFNIRDKVNVASLLVVALTGRMEYLTEILRLLLHRLIEKNVSTKHPQLMLRRAESVIEKMLANWMALCMYNYLKDMAGPSLFLLYKAIKYQVEKGPVDAVTHDARYSLSEERLLREQITHSPVIIHLVRDDPPYEKIPFSTPQTVAVLCEDGEKVTCRVLDCDTITQVKAKILDGLYRNTPHSHRPSVHEVDLEWRHGRNGHLVLADEDMTTKADSNGWRRLNTLAHYGISDIAVMAVVPKVQDHHTYNNANCGIKCNSCTGYTRSVSGSPLSFASDNESGQMRQNVYHLVRPVDHDSPYRGGCERGHKAIPEIFLTRLLSTKGTVQKFVDDFFRTILNPCDGLPPAIKWLFDFFDESARRHGITDPEVVLAWKSNSLPLRFWVNFIKNPDFILDVHKTPTVDSCLSVIAQTFMDACSTSEHRLGKDSPSNKLLFAKDMNQYRTMVRAFYQGIKELNPVTDQDMAAHLHQLSLSNVGKLDTFSALHELFHSYIARYYPQIIEALEVDPDCRNMHLAHKLDNIMCTLNGEATSLC